MEWKFLSIGLITIAIVRYFYHLSAFPCFFDDEFQTVAAAYGYLKTGTFYTWDYVNDCISPKGYSRAWPYTILLAGWMNVFGTSELVCRSLSALLGVLTIISCIYTTKKLFNHIEITLCTCLIVITNTTATYYFRFTRMYALLIFVCVWLVYFIYKALTESNHINEYTENKFLLFIQTHFDFNIKYMLISLFLLLLAWQIHINSLIVVLGIFPFIIFKVLTDKNKKYKLLLCFVCILGGMITLGLFYVDYFIRVPVIGKIIGSLMRHGSVFKSRHIEYLIFVMKEFGSASLAVLFLFTVVIFVLNDIREKRYSKEADLTVYCSGITLMGIFFLVFVADRYYSPQYIVMLIPVSAVCYAIGYSTLHGKHIVVDRVINVVFFMAVIYTLGMGYKSIYTIADTSDYINAYKTVSLYYDLDYDEIPVVHLNGRGYYYSRIWKKPILQSFNKENDMEILLEFSKKYNKGILTCEKVKIGNLTQGVGDLIMNWTDRISGDGLDNYNVETSYFSFLDGMYISEPILLEGAIQLNSENGGLSILMDLERLPKGTQLVCIQLKGSAEQDVDIKKHYQLRVDGLNKEGCYRYSIDINEFDNINVSDIVLNNEFAVYIKGSDELTIISNQ